MPSLRSRTLCLVFALSLLLFLQGCIALMAAGVVAGGVEGYRASQHHKAG